MTKKSYDVNHVQIHPGTGNQMNGIRRDSMIDGPSKTSNSRQVSVQYHQTFYSEEFLCFSFKMKEIFKKDEEEEKEEKGPAEVVGFFQLVCERNN